MTAGRAGSDLGRIETGRWYAECDHYGCDWTTARHAAGSKSAAIRAARNHAADHRHPVMLRASVAQAVLPL